MRLQMKQLQDAQTQLDEVETAMKTASADQSQFASFTRTRTTKEKRMVPAAFHSTICGTCAHICHYQCGLSKISQKGSNQFKECNAFGGASNCRICPRSCSYTDHFHDCKGFVEEHTTLEEVIEDIKAKYDHAVDAYAKAQSQHGGLAAARLAVESGVTALMQRVQDSCSSIRQQCRDYNFAVELSVTIRQLEGDRDKLSNLKAIEITQRFIETVKVIVYTMSAHADSSADVYEGAAVAAAFSSSGDNALVATSPAVCSNPHPKTKSLFHRTPLFKTRTKKHQMVIGFLTSLTLTNALYLSIPVHLSLSLDRSN